MDIDSIGPAPLLSAGLLLARKNIYSMAWLDSELFITARFGELAPGLEVGDPLFESLPILADYEDDIRATARGGHSPFSLPGIMLMGAGGQAGLRMDILIFHHDEAALAAQHKTDDPRNDSSADRAPDNASADASLEETSDRSTQSTPTAGHRFLLVITRAGTQSMDVAVARLQRDRQILLEDIEQKKLELDHVNAELELCNRDLEDFATVISHDLKAPMRALRYLSDDIETALDQQDSDAARSACKDLKTQSRRMATMLTQLLEYVSVGRQQDSLQTCDTRTLIEQITNSIPRPSSMRLVTEGDWPVIDTYIAPLDLILRNLIDNAIKYHDRPAEAVIRLKAQPSPGSLEITIEDDGPGIALNRQEVVFYPFRSFPKITNPATGAAPEVGRRGESDMSQGMGLAFVKRTIETVGGTIELRSNPEIARGTSFVISWPDLGTAKPNR